MAVYTVHLKGDDQRALARAFFVPEKFSWGAFCFGPLWLLRHGLWLATLAWIAIVALYGVFAWPLFAAPSSFGALFVLQVLLGAEGNRLRRGRLQRRGYRLADIVAGGKRDAAEAVFFARYVPPKPPAPYKVSTAAAGADNTTPVGMFPEREQRR